MKDEDLLGKTFGITFIKKTDVENNDLLLVVDAKGFVDPNHRRDVISAASLVVVDGAHFKKHVQSVSDSDVCLKLVRI